MRVSKKIRYLFEKMTPYHTTQISMLVLIDIKSCPVNHRISSIYEPRRQSRRVIRPSTAIVKWSDARELLVGESSKRQNTPRYNTRRGII